jgi:hypothetical protein
VSFQPTPAAALALGGVKPAAEAAAAAGFFAMMQARWKMQRTHEPTVCSDAVELAQTPFARSD